MEEPAGIAGRTISMAYASLLAVSDFGLTTIGLLWIAIHLLGIFAAWLVRLPASRRYAILVQGGFFTLLLAVSVTTLVGHVCCLEMWPLSAVTLALMIVMAIVDLGSEDSDAFPIER